MRGDLLRAVTVGLALLGAGCRTPVLEIPSGSTLLFPPAQTRFVLFQVSRVEARGFTGNVLWNTAVPFPSSEPRELGGIDPGRLRGRKVWVVASPSGDRLVAVGRSILADAAALTVMFAADGAVIETVDVRAAWLFDDLTDASEHVALSADGVWLGATTGTNDDTVVLQPVPTGAPFPIVNPPHRSTRVAFDPSGSRLAVEWLGAEIDVYELAGGQWGRSQRWEKSACPRWTDRGLGFVSADAVHLADRQGGNVRITSEDLSPWLAVHEACDYDQLSPDGAWRLRVKGWSASVIDARRGAEAFAYAWKPVSAPGLWGSAFAGDRLRLFTKSGLLIDFSLSSGKRIREEDFGQSVVFSHAMYSEGGSSSALYLATLSPSGDWISIQPQSGAISLYR